MVLHERPGSQAAVPQQAWPIAPHAPPIEGLHMPPVQARPALQALAPQQASPSPPQAAPGPVPPPSAPPVELAAQVPLRHTAPGLHASEPQHDWPTSPQGPGVPPPGVPPPGVPPPGVPPPGVPASVPPAPLDEHTPPMHEKPALHATPPQHVSPLPPQGAGMPPDRRAHDPRWHERPELQAVPPQHVCISSPQGVGMPPVVLVRHEPAVHARPGLQAVPQHICPSPPQAAGAGLHTALTSQVRPGLHELPLQQGWSESPQGAGMVHMSATHASVPAQVAPGQQCWPSLPQRWHMPVTHAKPAWQMSPAQHVWPSAPHAAAAAAHMPPVQVVPSQHSALDSQRAPER
jgi:hypothetical protein